MDVPYQSLWSTVIKQQRLFCLTFSNVKRHYQLSSVVIYHITSCSPVVRHIESSIVVVCHISGCYRVSLWSTVKKNPKIEDTKWVFRYRESKRDGQYKDKRTRTKGQALIFTTPHRNLNIELRNLLRNR